MLITEKHITFLLALYAFVQLLNFCFFENIIFSKKISISKYLDYSEHEHKKVLKAYFPNISIIIPCYQKGQYLPRAFISCIEDQYLKKYNIIIEIICIDDGSTDKTFQIFQKLKNKYDPYNMHENNSVLNDKINSTLPYNCHIKIFHFTRNHGALYSRLFGYKQTKADYVMSLDADDEFIPGIMVHLLKLTSNRKDIDIIQFRMVGIKESVVNQRKKSKEEKTEYSVFKYGEYPFDISNNIILNNTIQRAKYQLIDINQNDIDSIPFATYIKPKDFKNILSKINVMWNMPGLFIKKEIIKKATDTLDFINESIKINGYEDRLIAYVCYYFCHKFYLLDEVGYIYHLSIRSAARKPSLHYIDGIITELYKFGKINKSKYLYF